jgi:hypothetical protein
MAKAKLTSNFLGTAAPLSCYSALRRLEIVADAIACPGFNSVENAAPGRVKDFVAQNGGHTVITSVLIANNGIAAVKEIRSIRKWYTSFILELTSSGRMKRLEMNGPSNSSSWPPQTI